MTVSYNPMFPLVLYVAAGMMGGMLADAFLPWEYAGVGGFVGGMAALALVIHLLIRDMDTEPEATP